MTDTNQNSFYQTTSRKVDTPFQSYRYPCSGCGEETWVLTDLALCFTFALVKRAEN